uniref:putative ATP-dependent zinc protease n=1 Tax=Vibrio owensii TaxID=696485 RepID=UPI001A8E454B
SRRLVGSEMCIRDRALGDRMWPVEFTLACRKSMRYRVLLGSKALIAGQLVVNPALAYVQDRPESPAALPAATSIDLLDGSPCLLYTSDAADEG